MLTNEEIDRFTKPRCVDTGLRLLRNRFQLEEKPPLSPIPSEALQQICEDIAGLPPDISFNGNVWVKYESTENNDKLCQVCLAGITMLYGRCNIEQSPTLEIEPAWYHYSRDDAVRGAMANGVSLDAYEGVTARHVALNLLRLGEWASFQSVWLRYLRSQILTTDTTRIKTAHDSLAACLVTKQQVTAVTGYNQFRSVADLPELQRLAALCATLGF